MWPKGVAAPTGQPGSQDDEAKALAELPIPLLATSVPKPIE